MTPFYPLFVFSVLSFAFTALGQQQIQVKTPTVVQCANVLIQWTGGVSPFNINFATTPDANISTVEVVPNVQSSPYTWPDDLAAGTPFTIGVTDSNGNSGESQTIVVQDSTNTSCLDNSQDSPPTSVTSHTSHIRGQAGVQTSVGTSSSSTDTGAPAATAASSNPQSSPSSHTSRVPIIAGVVAGVLTLFSVIAILLYLQRRKDRRRTTAKEEMIRTFGSSKAALDSPADDGEAEEMAVPEPYVYKSVTRATFTNLAPAERDSPRHSGTSTSRSLLDSSPTPPPPNLAARKGERYLPNNTTTLNDTGPGGSSQSRMQEEDIDRLAARMVAMMSSGRLSDQAWAPKAGGRDARNKDFDVEDDFPAAPPMYNDVARRNSGAPHPSGRR